MNSEADENRKGMRSIMDAHLIWDIIGVCNFNCDYCIAGSGPGRQSVEDVDVGTVSRVLADTGLTYEINLVGGEPTILPNFIELCQELTRNNYIFLSTNLSNAKIIKRLSEIVDADRITGIDASFHVEQREKRSSFEQFAKDFHRLKDRGFKITANYVAHPRLMGRIEDDTERMADLGVELKITPFIGKWQNRNYPASYTPDEHRALFSRTGNQGKWNATLGEGIRGRLCNAGYNVFWVARNGVISKCTSYLGKTYGNIYQKIEPFDNKLERCHSLTCTCPYYSVLPHYFEKAKKDSNI